MFIFKVTLTYFSVVDVYQEWSGPVKPLIANLRRLKNELGDDKLKFLVVSYLDRHVNVAMYFEAISLENYTFLARINNIILVILFLV